MTYYVISQRIQEAFTPETLSCNPISAKYNSLTRQITMCVVGGTKIEFNELASDNVALDLLLQANGQMNPLEDLNLGYFERLNSNMKNGNTSARRVYLHCVLDHGYLVGYAYSLHIAHTECAYMTQVKTLDVSRPILEITKAIIVDIFEYHELDIVYLMAGQSQCENLQGKLEIPDTIIDGPRVLSDSPLRQLLDINSQKSGFVETIRIISKW